METKVDKLNPWKRERVTESDERDLARRVGERADIFRETSETSLEKLVKYVSLETLGRPVGEHKPEGQRE